MLSKSDRVYIEKNQRLSNSCLWDFQREYFHREGVKAWVKDVPFYVTSNPFLANTYAHMAVRLAQDWVRKYPSAKDHPFYIIELGTGSGRLSYYILKKIKQLQQQLQIEDISIRYIMTDFTENNMRFWDTHPALRPFVAENRLDFALFNMESDTSLNLIKSGITLSPGGVVNPIIAYANYVFDTVSQDTFVVENGEIYESLVTSFTDSENMQDGKVINMEKIHVEYAKAPAAEKFYEDDTINAVVNSYKDKLKDSHFLLPIAGIKAISNLRKLSNDKLFLVSTDKGSTYLEELENLDQPDIVFHGSFSVMVNFHALATYIEQAGGTAIIQSLRSDIKTVAFCTGFQISDLPDFATAISENIERLSPADYFILHRNISENFQHAKINTLVSHLAFSDWDPHIYEKLSRQINEQITHADRVTTEYLVNHIPNLSSNFYFMPRTYDVNFDLGVLLHTLHRYKEAAVYYKKSEQHFGERFNLLYNMAICIYHSGDTEAALATFNRALYLNPDSAEAKSWVEFLSKE